MPRFGRLSLDSFRAGPMSATEALVESRVGAVAWGLWPTLRFPSPLIDTDMPISGIRLSDWLHRRHTAWQFRAGVRDVASRVLRRQFHKRTDVCHALPLCAVWRGNRARARRRIGQRRG